MKSKQPVIAILSYNRLDLLKTCLSSVFENTERPFEVCVVDQASSDGTREYLEKLGKRVDHVRTGSNLGFVLGNNLVIEKYGDRDVVLLNNDTEVQPGWLSKLAARAYADSKTGIVGPKLIFPDGRLQAAGGEVFADASAREIGKFDDPERFIYTQVADVDYVSGACMYIRREVLDTVGGFDTQFAPAYWEDTDLCFAARDAGFRVVFEPESAVVHVEGGSYGGPEVNSRSQELQARNKPKFIAKWIRQIEKRRSNVYEVRRDPDREQVLVILPFPAMADRASGERRWFRTLEMLAERYQVVLLVRNGVSATRYVSALEELGITVFHTDTTKMRHLGHEVAGPLWIDFPKILQANRFKAVISAFYHVAAQYYDEVRQYSPDSLLIIDSVDLHFAREYKRAQVSGEDADFWTAEETRRIELDWYRKVDMVLTVSEDERQVLKAIDPHLHVELMPDIHPLPEVRRAANPDGLVYVGNFNHPPNEDAVLHFVEAILPRIRKRLPGVPFTAVGNNPPPSVQALAGEGIEITGYVPDIQPYLAENRLAVVPLRYGAGVKGKVAEALAARIPLVVTPIGAEGTGGVDGRDFLVAEDDDAFVDAVVRLYDDKALQEAFTQNGAELVRRCFSRQNAERAWQPVFESVSQGRRHSNQPLPAATAFELASSGYTWLERRPKIAPKVSIVIPVHDNLEITRICWGSIRKNTQVPYEIVVVDNGSRQAVVPEAHQNNIRCIRNERNLGFAAAVNQGIRNSWSDYVVVLNNDCIVTPGWLDAMLAHLERDETIGIVVPTTNYANNEQRVAVEYKDEHGMYAYAHQLQTENRGQSQEIRKAAGVCMLVRRSAIENVGLFDERFGIGNFEDDDYSLRARIAGYKIVLALDTFVHHEGGMTFKALGIDYEALLRQNSEIFVRKWSPILTPSAPSKRGNNKATAELHVFVFQDEASISPAGLESLVGTLPKAVAVTVLCDGERAAEIAPRYTTTMIRRDSLYSTLDREIRSTSSPHVLVVSSKVRADQGWVEALRHIAHENTDVAIATPQFAAAQPSTRQQQRKTSVALSEPSGAALLIDRCAYVAAGGLDPGFQSSICWSDLALRLRDGGRSSVCIPASRIRFTAGNGTASGFDAEERRAVQLCREAASKIQGSERDDAAARLDEALALKSDYAQAHFYRAHLHLSQGNAQKAHEHLDAVVGNNPCFSQAYNDLGCMAFESGRAGDAESYFDNALQCDPANDEARRNLAQLHFENGKVETALELYVQVVEHSPEDPQNYVQLGIWFERLGDTSGAQEWYRKALRVAPVDSDARHQLETLVHGEQITV